MNISILKQLRCSFCSGSLNGSGRDCIGEKSGFGVLSCYCGRYPVVAGIPILKKGVISTARHTADQVIDLIEAGRHREALLSMLMPPPPASDELAPAWMQVLPSVRGIGRLKTLIGRLAQRHWREQVTASLMHSEDYLTACDLFDLYFRRSRGGTRELYNYFAYRFGQPRHLVALSLANLIHQPKKAILDLACGFGHITCNLVERAKDAPVIGVDRNFFMVYVAKNWLAPIAEYVCAEADTGLPFSDSTFSVTFCSDAFHWFANKATCFRELKRLTQDDGFIILATLRNALLENHLYPGTLPPDGYEALIGDIPHRMIANSDILARYLRKQAPPLACSAEMGHLSSEPWLSVVASHRQELLRDYGPFDDWPHAEGRLTLNPLYKQDGRDSRGNVHLHHTFPSAWYEKENGECRQYEPETMSISSKLLMDLAHGKRPPEIERLIEQCVVLGMPERFR
jgi:ubiquinone/menaquinone biosynthesis C-methylase UbiE